MEVEITSLSAYKEGQEAARKLIHGRLSQWSASNPYQYNTRDWKAWELGWKHILSSEQP